MSLAETREILTELEKIVALLEQVETKHVPKLKKDLPELTAVVITTQQSLRLIWRFSSLLNRMGLSDDVNEAIQRITQLTRMVMYLYYALSLLDSGTTYGLIAGVLGMINVGIIGFNQTFGRPRY